MSLLTVFQQQKRFFAFFALAVLGLASTSHLHAQLGDRLRRAAQRGVENALERNARQKTEEAVDEIFNPEKREEVSAEDIGLSEDDDYTNDGDQQSGAGIEGKAQGEYDEGSSLAENPFSYDSKFDFEPGEQIIQYDDFSRVALGDFPAGYNTNGTAEIVKLNGDKPFLKLTSKTGQIVAYEFNEFPENFTFEFDLAHNIPMEGYRYQAQFCVSFTAESDPEFAVHKNVLHYSANHLAFCVNRGNYNAFQTNFYKKKEGKLVQGDKTNNTKHFNANTKGQAQRFSIWRQGKRFRVYINEEKVFDMPLGWSHSHKIQGLRFFAAMSDENDEFFLSNLRLAKGAPDTRSKLETEGKIVSYGLTFDSGSAILKPESSGTLKAIATTLKDNPGMQIKITGHTDGDGSSESNLSLSKSRANAVRAAIIANYQIEADRISTEGKGESEPVSDNNSVLGKAQNRRVVIEVI